MSDPTSYRIFFNSTARPFDPLDIHDVGDLADPAVPQAVRDHVATRWPGAQLEVRINRDRMTGRVLAGSPPVLRRVAAFSLDAYSPDGTPPAAPPPDPRGDVDEDQAHAEHAEASR